MSTSLSDLKPNHIPSPEFELAPGWIMLITIGLIAVFYILLFLIKKHQRNAYRRKALLEINLLETNWQSSKSIENLQALGLILKTAAYEVDPKSSAFSGSQWLNFLQDLCPNITSSSFERLNSIQYSSPDSLTALKDDEISLIFKDMRTWVCEHRKKEEVHD